MSGVQRTALTIVIIGAINWGLIGFFHFDAISAIFGGVGTVISRIIYGIVGLAGLYSLILLFQPSEELAESAEPTR